MLFLPRSPQGPLAASIEQMFYLDAYQPNHEVERLVPDGSINLVIELDGRKRYIFDNETMAPVQTCTGAWISGVHQGYISISTPETELMAVRFFPVGCHPIFHLPLHQLNNKVVAAEDIFGPDILHLRDQLIHTNKGEGKLDVLEEWLLARFRSDLLPPEEIQQAVNSISQNPTISHLKELLEGSQYSQKHFIHLFKKFVGPSPKIFQRIKRFAEAFPLIQQHQQINWTQLGLDCGYYDQAHFIKDFKHFSGYNPKDFLAEGHDRLNFFPQEKA